MKMRILIIFLTACILSTLVCCDTPSSQQEITQSEKNKGNADVVFVQAIEDSEGSWTFRVSVSHPDIGWDDYVDGWDVVLPDGTVIKPDSSANFTRILTHPHVDEQPFTRSQSGIMIPLEVSRVRVRAHDIVDGYGGQEIIVDLETGKGNGYKVERIP